MKDLKYLGMEFHIELDEREYGVFKQLLAEYSLAIPARSPLRLINAMEGIHNAQIVANGVVFHARTIRQGQAVHDYVKELVS